MSIWNSWVHVGFDKWIDWAKRPTGGTVRGYAEGWSNHYPTNDVEGPACIDLASIPVWCVPGHEEEVDGKVGPWLRLSVHAEGPNRWQGDTARYQSDVTVVLNENAARALRDHLDEWLAMPKARPKRGAK